MNKLLRVLPFIVIIVVAFYSISSVHPPDIQSINASDSTFSASRAFKHVKEIAQAPHSIGTPEHDSVCNYIVHQCTAIGLKTHIQRKQAKRRFGSYLTAGNIENIIAVLPGADYSETEAYTTKGVATTPLVVVNATPSQDNTYKGVVTNQSKAVLIVCHYDSQPNTPGAADNASGVAAALETAANIQATQKKYRNDIIFLFTDGEEIGLLGAKAFLTDSLYLNRIGVVLNFEARGNKGVSTMFETNRNNEWIIKQYAQGAALPIANSLSYEIYKRLTNDTDFTIFKNKEIPGLNSALIDGYVNYHSMTDTPENLDLKSLQHHGMNMLSLAKHFANIDLNPPKINNDLSYFNPLATCFVYYPTIWNNVLLILQGLVMLTTIVFGLSTKQFTLRGLFAGALALPLTGSIAFYSTRFLIKFILWMHPSYSNFYASNSYNSSYYFFAITIWGALIFILLYHFTAKTFGQCSVTTGLLFITTLVLVTMFAFAPTASYLIIFPLLPVSIIHGFSVATHGKYNMSFWTKGVNVIGTFPTILLLSPTVYLLFTAFGLGAQTPITMLFIGVFLALLFPLLYGALKNYIKWITIILGLCLPLALILGGLNANFTEKQPLQTYVKYVLDTDKNEATWVTDRIDEGNRNFFPLPSKRNFDMTFTNPAPDVHVPSTIVSTLKDTTENNLRKLTIHISNPRKIPFMSLRFYEDNTVRNVSINDMEIYGEKDETALSIIDYFNVPREGLTVRICLHEAKLKLTLKETTIGLPTTDPKMTYSLTSIPGPGYRSNTVQVTRTIEL